MPGDQTLAETAGLTEIGSLLGGQARLLRLPAQADVRGSLRPLEFSELPFIPKRLFVVDDVPAGVTRGGHAHASCRQLLLVLAGEVMIELRYKQKQANFLLSANGRAILIEPEVWSRQTYVGEGSVLLVLASEPYDDDSYVSG
jgi:dTDP-4-dehydrorhamnose 3,5-epimerase-like enzyme